MEVSSSKSFQRDQTSMSKSEVVPISPDLRSDDRLLFMFVRSTDGYYLLYKIDVLSLLRENTCDEELLPLIVFDSHVLAHPLFTFEFLEPNFYVIGQERGHVFTLDKDKLLELSPSETRPGSEFLKPISPMHGKKVKPLSFVYNDRLYVISKGFDPILRIGKIYYDFEVYSPSHETWNQLGNTPIQDCIIKSHLILKHMVYFTTGFEVVLSYNLEDETWATIFDPDGVLYRFPEKIYDPPCPTFDTQIQVVGNMVLGGFYQFGAIHFDICASHAIDPHDDLFLRPTLTQDLDFFKKIYSRCRELGYLLSEYSKYIVTINENQGIICVICYGNHPWDDFSNDVVFNFFKVSGNSYKCDIPVVKVEEHLPIPYCWHSTFGYAHDGKRVNFFEAEFISSTLMPINTKKQRQVNPGLIYSCMFV